MKSVATVIGAWLSFPICVIADIGASGAVAFGFAVGVTWFAVQIRLGWLP